MELAVAAVVVDQFVEIVVVEMVGVEALVVVEMVGVEALVVVEAAVVAVGIDFDIDVDTDLDIDVDTDLDIDVETGVAGLAYQHAELIEKLQ